MLGPHLGVSDPVVHRIATLGLDLDDPPRHARAVHPTALVRLAVPAIPFGIDDNRPGWEPARRPFAGFLQLGPFRDAEPVDRERPGRAPIYRHEPGPVLRRDELPQLVTLARQGMQSLADHRIPIAVTVGPRQLGRQPGKRRLVVRVDIDVVPHLRRDEDARPALVGRVGRASHRRIVEKRFRRRGVDKSALQEAVRRAARIRAHHEPGQRHDEFGSRDEPAQPITGPQQIDLLVRHAAGLVQSDIVHLGAEIAPYVLLFLAVTKPQDRTVMELHRLAAFGISAQLRRNLGLDELDVVVLKLRQGPTEQIRLQPGIPQAEGDGIPP